MDELLTVRVAPSVVVVNRLHLEHSLASYDVNGLLVSGREVLR